jgi:ABC-type oligopeptide transport system substrate-binding subunit
VLINLTQPSAFLPEDLEINLETGSPGIGTGAFRIVSTSASATVLEHFEMYRDGSPSIERVVIRPFQTLRTAWTSLLRSEVDMVTDVPPQAVEFVNNDDVQVIPFERRYQYVIAFNSSKPPFNSPTVRRALNAAINREALVRVMQGQGPQPAQSGHVLGVRQRSPIPRCPARSSFSILPISGSLAASRRRARFRFTCLVPRDFSTWERIALEVQKNLYNVGVDMQFRVVPAAEFDTLIREGKFQAVLTDMISGPTSGRAYIFWRSQKRFKGLNVFGYENPEAERLFDVLQSATNEAAVRSATRGLQRTFVDDPPALFLAWTQRARAVRRTFRIPQEAGRDPVSTLSRWVPIAPVLTASAP